MIILDIEFLQEFIGIQKPVKFYFYYSRINMKYPIKKKLLSCFSFVTYQYDSISQESDIMKIVDLPFKNIQHYNASLHKIVLYYSNNKFNFAFTDYIYTNDFKILNNYGKIKIYQKIIEDDDLPHVCYAKIFWRSKTDKVLFLLQQG